jgi:surfactin synthase thioesterase subunit
VLVDLLADALEPHARQRFAMFGHSTGAMLAFETERALRSRLGVAPEALFISGRRAPQFSLEAGGTRQLTDEEFLEEVRHLTVPILRADFAVCRTYRHVPGPRLACQ